MALCGSGGSGSCSRTQRAVRSGSCLHPIHRSGGTWLRASARVHRAAGAPLDKLLGLRLSHHSAWPGPHLPQPLPLSLPRSLSYCWGLNLPPHSPFPSLCPFPNRLTCWGEGRACVCMCAYAQPPPPQYFFSLCLYLCTALQKWGLYLNSVWSNQQTEATATSFNGHVFLSLHVGS